MIYFTADQHFGHEAIMAYEHRAFKTTSKMDAELVRRYNDVVQHSDTVYFLGDLALAGPTKKDWLHAIVERMHGKKHLVLGNHDRLSPWDYAEMGFLSVHTALELEVGWDVPVVLAHDPAIAEAVQESWCFHGHVHSLFKRQRNAVNVGVDVWDYRPVSIVQLYAFLGSLRANPEQDECKANKRRDDDPPDWCDAGCMYQDFELTLYVGIPVPIGRFVLRRDPDSAHLWDRPVKNWVMINLGEADDIGKWLKEHV